jgi:hypothetical protein
VPHANQRAVAPTCVLPRLLTTPACVVTRRPRGVGSPPFNSGAEEEEEAAEAAAPVSPVTADPTAPSRRRRSAAVASSREFVWCFG